MKTALYAALSAMIFALCGCSSGNDSTTILDSSGKHPSDWAVAGTGGKHPSAYLAGPSSCYECHGSDLMGGISNVSCFSASRSGITCHAGGPGTAHPVPYIDHSGPAQANMPSCLGCHQIAENTTSPPGCMNCHLTSPLTNPNNCISCHQKPPGGTVYPNNAGSHTHNSLNVPQNSTQTAQCDQCHQGLGLGTVDHFNRSRSRSSSLLPDAVLFGSLAKTGGLVPVFNPATGSCALTYCHGNTLAGGTNKTPVWGTTLSGCGTCHGYPPDISAHTGVTAATPCIGCHPDVATTTHINGTVEANAGGHAFPYSGSVHRPGGTGNPLANAAAPYTNCSGCHDTTSLNGTYPVASGVKPLCSACHLNMTRFTGTTPGCWDCHGSSAADGRPNGTTFPNRQGSSDGHNRGTHQVACTVCHPITTGSTAHGWSNNAPKSTNAQVLPTLNWNPGSRESGHGSCNPSAGGISNCHGSEIGWY